MSVRGLESFNKYKTIADLATTTGCPVVWNVPNPELLSYARAANGVGQCLYIGGGQVNPYSAVLNGRFPANNNGWILGLGFYLQTTLANGVCDVQLVNWHDDTFTGKDIQATIHFSGPTNTIEVLDASSATLTTLANAFLNSDWFYTNLIMNVGTTDGSIELIINNDPIWTDGAVDTQAGTATTWNGIVITVPSNAGTLLGGVAFGDFTLQDITPGDGVIPTGQPLGPVYLDTIYPSSNSSTAWSADNSLPNYQEVNTPQSNDGSTSISATQGLTNISDLYGLNPVDSVLPICAAIQAFGQYKNTGSVQGTILNNISSSGAIATASTLDIGADTPYQYAAGVIETDPATGTNFSVAGLNALLAGPTVGPNPSAVGTVGSLLGTQTIALDGASNGGYQSLSSTSTSLYFTYSTQTNCADSLLGDFNFSIQSGDGGGNGVQVGVSNNLGTLIAFSSVGGSFILGPPSTPFSCSGTIVFNEPPLNVEDASVYISFSTLGTTYTSSAYLGGITELDTFIVSQTAVGGVTNNVSVQVNRFVLTPNVVYCAQYGVEVATFAANYGGESGMPLIFPNLIGITYPIVKRPIWGNVVSTGASGAEARVGLWPYPLWEWELEFSYLPDEQANGSSASDLKTLMGFFLAVQGNLLGFLFNDPDDNFTTASPIATTDGTTSSFIIFRKYGLTNTGIEPIGYLNLDTTPIFYLNGTAVSVDDYTLNDSTPLEQLIVFNTPPTSGQALTWTGAFYYYVRFGEEKQDFTKTMNLLWETNKLVVRSLRQE